eukprot:TRINITY_DN21266_c0_g1_i1.p2 TRINITY_DN21266_c0_g1~~TRINITY_DN21266_c0_g1_i1.p2  ORF type:complete len:111 (+),score=12.39 TRINITY_DN21266_c0_g1_i1:108-440(+)
MGAASNTHTLSKREQVRYRANLNNFSMATAIGAVGPSSPPALAGSFGGSCFHRRLPLHDLQRLSLIEWHQWHPNFDGAALNSIIKCFAFALLSRLTDQLPIQATANNGRI